MFVLSVGIRLLMSTYDDPNLLYMCGGCCDDVALFTDSQIASGGTPLKGLEYRFEMFTADGSLFLVSFYIADCKSVLC